MTTLALVPPPPREATHPSPVTRLRPRQVASLSEQAVTMASLAMEGGPEFASQVADFIRLALLEASAS